MLSKVKAIGKIIVGAFLMLIGLMAITWGGIWGLLSIICAFLPASNFQPHDWKFKDRVVSLFGGASTIGVCAWGMTLCAEQAWEWIDEGLEDWNFESKTIKTPTEI